MTFQQQITALFSSAVFTMKKLWKLLRKEAYQLVEEARQQWNSCQQYSYQFDQSAPVEGYVYIIEAVKDGYSYWRYEDQWTGYYIGATKMIIARIAEHLSGFGCIATSNAIKDGFALKVVAAIQTDDIYRLESLLKQASQAPLQFIDGQRSIGQVIAAAQNLNGVCTKSRIQERMIKRVKTLLVKKLLPWYSE